MKEIIKNFNNLIKKTIFKVQNKTNNNFNISNFNKFLIIFIASLFFYLFYLLIPLLYDKTWVQTYIESKLIDEFKVDLDTSAEISYRILPAPHFLIKDSKILVGDSKKMKSIAEIKNFKVFLGQGNFLDKKKIDLQKIIISNANFSLLRSDIKLLSEFKNKKFSDKKIKVINSNIFIKDNLGETISIIKIDNAILFFDNNKLSNLLNLKGEVFNVPFDFNFQNKNDPYKYENFNFNFKSLKLDIFNEFILRKDKVINGKNAISFFNSTINTKYNVKEKLVNFESDNSRLDNSQVNYTGELSINPFDLDLNINLDNHKISKLFNINLALIEFIQSGLLFNENISVNISIGINSKIKNEIFQNAKIYLHIINGKINLDNTRLVNNEIGLLELNNSNLFFKDNNLIFNSDILIDIKNSDKLFSLLNTDKQSRKFFKTILVNLNYNFLTNQIEFNNIKIDNKNISNRLLTIIDSFTDNDLNNPVKSRRLLNEVLKAYEG
tara:strand:+ start:214 stop:1698 length:1485 start_codon:yes stop_codon:yes gene_type:complete